MIRFKLHVYSAINKALTNIHHESLEPNLKYSLLKINNST